ncbi:MAG: hypothetical protein K1000chlam4_00811 [Chlamydiae bacterium]|nr:hypothetical protein [Chlamydiota bacterium]
MALGITVVSTVTFRKLFFNHSRFHCQGNRFLENLVET